MKKKATLKEIANELGVSISTVSKALKGSTEISEETTEKIKAFARLLHYRPNNIALSLKNRRTKTIGVIIPEIVHHFFSEVIQGIETFANEKGYNVLIALSNESFDKEVFNIDTLASGSIDGFILSVSKGTLKKQDFYHLYETINQGMPIVLFDRQIPEISCDKVIVDDFHGSRRAVEALMNAGCRHIALITTEDYVDVGFKRTQGYLDAHLKHGIAQNPDLVLKVNDQFFSEDTLIPLQSRIKELFLLHPEVDGIFGVNEVYALTGMKVAQRMGYRIPEDIQVVGFTDGVLSKHAHPSLTSVKQHGQNIGREAVQMLIRRLESDLDGPFETKVLQTELVQRESTRFVN